MGNAETKIPSLRTGSRTGPVAKLSQIIEKFLRSLTRWCWVFCINFSFINRRKNYV